MHPGSDIAQVFLCQVPVDFRKSIDGLSAMVEQTLRLNLFEASLFVFVNRGRTKIKALYWHRNGFCLWYKRLEAQRFAWPQLRQEGAECDTSELTYEISKQQLEWLLEGFDLWLNEPHKTLHFARLS
jgi:transposase